MCSRYLLIRGRESLARMLRMQAFPEGKPRYNVAPTQRMPVVRRGDDAERTVAELRWGLIPGWSRGPGRMASVLTNARAETLTEKPAFRDAYARRRCLVPADGFYEWRKRGDRRMPFLFERADGEPLVFAGLWERWQGEGAEPLESFTIVTTAPNALVGELHDRMPVILPREAEDAWLEPKLPARELAALLVSFPAEAMVRRAVHPRVNVSSYDAPDVLEAPPAEPPGPEQLGLGF